MRRAAVVRVCRRMSGLLALAGWVVASAVTTGCRGREAAVPSPAPMAAPTSELPFTLYYPGSDGQLHPEGRTFQVPEDPVGRARVVIAGLLAGPRDSALHAPFASRVELGNVVLPANGTLYLDLRAEGPPPGMGSTDELLAVYSLVDTAAWAVPEVRRVVLLWNGVQPESLAGHVDTANPLLPSKAWVASVPAATAASAATGEAVDPTAGGTSAATP